MPREVVGSARFEADQAIAEIRRLTTTLDKMGPDLSRVFDQMATASAKGLEKIESGQLEARLERLSGRLLDLGRAGFQGLSSFLEPSSQFYDSTANLNTITKLQGESLEALNEQLRTTGQRLQLGVTPTQAASAAYEVFSVRSDGAAKNIKTVDAAIQLSKAGRAEFADSAKLLTSVMNSYGFSQEQAATVTDKLLKSVEIGGQKIPEFAQSFGLVGSIAAQSGVTIDELSASISVATANGNRTSTAMEGLRSVLNNLTKPSDEAEKTFARLGIRVDGTTLKAEGFFNTLDKIGKAAKGNSVDLATIFSDASGRALALNLIDERGLKAQTVQARASIQDAAGTTAAFIQEQKKSPLEARKELQASYEAFAVGVGNTAAPALTKLLNAGSQVLTLLDKLPGPIKTAGLAAAGFATAAVTAAGAVIGLGLAIPAVQGAMATMGAQSVALAARASAMWVALNAPVTVASITGAFATIQATGTAALGAVSTAATGMASALAAAGPLILIAVAAIGVAAWSEHAKQMEILKTQYAGAGLELANLGEVAAGKRGSGGSLGDLLLTDSKKLLAAGTNLEQFGLTLQKLRDDLENAKGADRDKILKEIEQLRAKREEFAKLLADQAPKPAAQAAIGPSQKDIEAAQKQAEKNRENALADRLQEIEQSRATAREKIAAFNEVLRQLAREPEERRNINRQIFQEQEKITKYEADQAKKRRDNALADSLQEIELSKAPLDAKIKALEAIRTKFTLNATEERQLAEKIGETHKKIDDERLKRLEKIAGLQATAADLDRQKSDQALSELKTKQDRGIDTTAEQLAELDKRRLAQQKEDQAKLQKDLLETSDPAAQNLLRANEKKREELGEGDFAQRALELRRSQAKSANEDRANEVASARALSAEKVQLLQEDLEKGKEVGEQLKRAILDRVALQEQEIALKLQAERLATDNPVRLAKAEQAAQLELLEAKRKGRQEIEATTAAIEKQKQASKTGGLGGTQTLEEFAAELNKTFGSDVTNRINQIRSGASGKTPFQLDTRELESRIKSGQVSGNPFIDFGDASSISRAVRQTTSLPIRAAEGRSGVTEVLLRAELRLLDLSGRERQYEVTNQEVTVDGRNSNLAVRAARLSKSTVGV